MKRLSYLLISFVLTVTLFNSCTPEITVFDKSLLTGVWVSGTEYYRYDSDGNGVTWDTSDNVTEATGQKFTWTLINSELTQNHILEIGGTVPKTYTLTELTTTTLKYKDDFGVAYSFTKVN